MAAFLGALLFASVVGASNNCTIQPIFVDFHVRAVDGGVSEQYGLFTGVGSTASQNLSLWPSFSNNETTVGGLEYCTGSRFADCINHSHGFYSPELSQTWVPLPIRRRIPTLTCSLGTLLAHHTNLWTTLARYLPPSSRLHLIHSTYSLIISTLLHQMSPIFQTFQ